MANLLWLQGGACSGNTMSFLNAEEPSACDLVTDFGINILWHPSLGMELGENLKSLLRSCISGEIALDIFVFEGTVVNAPDGTGEWNRFAGRPMKEWVKELSDAAGYVVAIGDCATWGGIPAMAPNPERSGAHTRFCAQRAIQATRCRSGRSLTLLERCHSRSRMAKCSSSSQSPWNRACSR